jgi:hypothetical protein
MRPVEIVEQVVIVLAIASLWPFVFLNYREPWYQWGALPGVAIVMALVLARKWRRLDEALRDARERAAGGMPGPPPPTSTPGNSRKGSGNGEGNG